MDNTGTHLTLLQLHRWMDLDRDSVDSNGEDESDFIEAHLETCQQCAELLESLAPDNHSLVRHLREIDFKASLMETIAEEYQQTVGDGQERRKRPQPATCRWTPIRLLAVGGIGEIWIAQDELLGRQVAVKRLRAKTASVKASQQRFLYEARVTAQLNHPGIVHIFDLIDDGPRSYYAMSLIKGQTLQEMLAEFHQRKSLNRVNHFSELFDLLRVWASVARTIAFAHSQNVLHRDIKSENIIVGEFGEVTVIDWGIAKRLDDESTPHESNVDGEEGMPLNQSNGVRQTRMGARLGTPAFMSPEQARGDVRALDERTDVYSLAAMLYEILTGVTPFEANSAEAMLEQVLTGTLVPPRQRSSLVSERLNEICLKGLARDPDERYQMASDFAAAVEDWMNSETLKQQTDLARQKLFDLSTDLMVIFDQVPKILWVNAAWERSLGWGLDDLVGLKPNVLVHREDLDADDVVFEELNEGVTATGLERRVQASDGSYHWFSFTATPLIDEEITVAIGRSIDELVRRRDEFANLLEAAPEAIVVVNLDHTIHRVNKSVITMFGYTEAELIGQRIDVLVPARYHQVLGGFFDSYLAKIETTPNMHRDKLQGRHKDGNEFELGLRLSPVETEGGVRIVTSIRRSIDKHGSPAVEISQ